MIETLLSYGLMGSAFLFALLRLALYTQFFQQEEYDARRFFDIVFHRFYLIDKKLTAALLIGAVVFSVWDAPAVASSFLIILFLIFSGLQIKNIRGGKKPLVYTMRVKRILSAAAVLLFVLYLNVWVLAPAVFSYVGHMAFVQLIPVILVIGNWLLIPVEKYIQKKLYAEAVKKLETINPTVVGITGSYGKTSVKHILSHILGQSVPTLATPGSINTVMGITRIIREKLEPHHKIFIAEMGAYGKGSIKRLCDFCPPHHGILTAVGFAHYERFKSVDQVAAAKFELFNAVSDKKGFFVVNADQVEQRFIETYASSYGDRLIIFSSNPKHTFAQIIIRSSQTTAKGLNIALDVGGQPFEFTVPLFGPHQVSNCVAAVALALALGMPMDTIVAALQSVPQITHRLEVKPFANGPTIIDDAYNSNPEGFASALEALSVLKQARGGRAILITPGMVELGALHDQKHAELGAMAAQMCDEIVLIGAGRIPTFAEAIRQAGKTYHYFDKLSEAKSWLSDNAHINDVVLYENDLPDLYEHAIRL